MPLDPTTVQLLAAILGPGLAVAANELIKIPIKSLTTPLQEQVDQLVLSEYRVLEQDAQLILAIEKTLKDSGFDGGPSEPRWLTINSEALEQDRNYEARAQVVLAVAKAAKLTVDPTAIPKEVSSLLVVEPHDLPKLATFLSKLRGNLIEIDAYFRVIVAADTNELLHLINPLVTKLNSLDKAIAAEVVEELLQQGIELIPASAKPPASQVPFKPYQRLVGRSDEVEAVLNALRDLEGRPIVAITGLGGIGKTAIAYEATEISQKERIFSSIIWLTAKAEHFTNEAIFHTNVPEYDYQEILNEIGHRSGLDEIASMTLKEKEQIVRTVLVNHRVLLVIDNFDTIPKGDRLLDEITQILGKSKVLITSRYHVKHDRCFLISLKGLSQEDGVIFLREEGKARGIKTVAQAKQQSLIEIYEVTGGAPLAMKLVVGQLYRLSMDKVLEALREASISGPDYDLYRFIFKHSWDMLSSVSRKVLVSMAAFAPTIGGPEDAIRIVSDVPEPEFSQALDQLVLMSLLDALGEINVRRYALHQLTHYFILSDIVKRWGNGSRRE